MFIFSLNLYTLSESGIYMFIFQATVKKYVKEERFERVYLLVLALKGVEEAIYRDEASLPTETDSSGT